MDRKLKEPKPIDPAKNYPPSRLCPACKGNKFDSGFTTLSSESGTDSQTLCAPCFNELIAKRLGIAPPNPAEFTSIVVHDAIGKAHTFYFDVRISTGLGIRAFEWINGAPGGDTFGVLLPPNAKSTEAYEKLVAKIKVALSVRYIQSSDFDGGMNRLYIKGTAINGQIEERPDEFGEFQPIVVVDGKEYTWAAFGQCMSSYTGFKFRLECFDMVDDIPIDPDPQRPDPCWWLEKHSRADEEKSFQ